MTEVTSVKELRRLRKKAIARSKRIREQGKNPYVEFLKEVGKK